MKRYLIFAVGLVYEVVVGLLPWAALAALGLAFIYSLAWILQDSPAKTQAKYSAWCKATGVTNLTVQEWKVLYSAEILPGQAKRDRSGEAMAVGIAVGSSIK